MPPGTRNCAKQAEIDARMVAELMVPGALSVILGEKLVGSVGVKLAMASFFTFSRHLNAMSGRR